MKKQINKNKFEAIIFDMDGVIINSEKEKFKFLQKIFTEAGLSLENKSFSQVVGVRVSDFLDSQSLNNFSKKTILKKIKNIFLKNKINFIKPIKENIDFIKQYKGNKKLAIASNGDKESNKNIAEYLKINKNILHIVSSDRTKLSKPHPYIYLKAAKILNVNPNNCIVIEDSIIGVEAATRASMNCCVFFKWLQ
ncbi:MAG: HAD family phosphatase [Candidatus Pacebacteria bacterium]|nr:HAD family phosphatase [Candidatus Paceibacterota bacterium]